MHDDLVKKTRHCATAPMHCLSCGEDKDGRCFKRLMTRAADAIEELSKLADAIPHVCECCIGCEIESGGCDNAFVLSPKRVREYLSKPRWIPVTERLPKYGERVLVFGGFTMYVAYYDRNRYGGESWHKLNSKSHYCNPTHWMPLPEPPKEETE